MSGEDEIIDIYLGLRDHLAQAISEHYPGYRMRIYTNVFSEVFIKAYWKMFASSTSFS